MRPRFYAVGYAWTLDELYQNFDSQALKIDGVSLIRLYGDNHKKRLCYRMFRECVKIIVKDIIDNDVEFKLPVGSRKTSLRMRTYTVDEFKEARRNGKFMEVDFLSSGFIANQIELYMYGHRNIPRTKSVYLHPSYKELITKYTNEGRSYYGKNVKTIKDYYSQVQKLFPWIPATDVHKILNFGWRSLYLVNSYGGDVAIQDVNFWFYTGCLHSDSLKHFEYYKTKLCNKMRVMFLRKKIKWDGYYYFGLSDERYQEWKSSKKKKGRPRKNYDFGNIKLYKMWEECKIAESGLKYFFKIPYPINMGFTFYCQDLKTGKAEFILAREPLKFQDILISNNDYEFI